MVVIYAIHDDGKMFTMTTYGKSKTLCRHAADLGRQFARAVFSSKVEPAEEEPLDVPSEPTIFQSVERSPLTKVKEG